MQDGESQAGSSAAPGAGTQPTGTQTTGTQAAGTQAWAVLEQPQIDGTADLARACRSAGVRAALVELPADDSDRVFLFLAGDGSGFFASQEGGDELIAWPICERGDDRRIDESDMTPRADPAIVAGLLPKRPGMKRHSEMPDGLESFLEACAREMIDPPVGIVNMFRQTEHAFSWGDAASRSDEICSLIADFVRIHENQAVTCTIRAATEPARSTAQRREDARMMDFFENRAPQSAPRPLALIYSGRAYATVDDLGNEMLDGLVGWFSAEVMQRLGEPVGWEIDYNDGAGLRSSGWSAYAETETLDVAPLSAHQAVRAVARIREWLTAEGLFEAYRQELAKSGLGSPLVT